MQRFERQLLMRAAETLRRSLSCALLLSALSSSANAQAVRPRIFVSADLRKAPHVREKLLNEEPRYDPEQIIANAAVRYLSVLRAFEFLPGTCPDIASKVCQLHLVLTSEGRGWPATELKLIVQLKTPNHDPPDVAFGTVLKAYENPPSFGDASWLEGNIVQLVSAWPDRIRRLFGTVPIEAEAELAGQWVTVKNTTYGELGLAPDQAVLSVGSDEGISPKTLFRVCHPAKPSGPVIHFSRRTDPEGFNRFAVPFPHCDELEGSPSTSPSERWQRVFLWYYSGSL